MRKTFRRFAGPGILFFVASGLEVSPIESIWLSIFFWSIAVAWMLGAVGTLPLVLRVIRSIPAPAYGGPWLDLPAAPPHQISTKAEGRLVPGPEDDFVESDGVLWQWYEYYRKGKGGMEGPLCPWNARVLDYRPSADVTPPAPNFNSLRSVLHEQIPKERKPMDEDRVGGFNGGTLVCFKCDREFGLSEKLVVFNDLGKTVGEARQRALEEFRAKVRQRELAKPSAPDTEDSQPQ